MELVSKTGTFTVEAVTRITPKIKNEFVRCYSKMQEDPRDIEKMEVLKTQDFNIDPNEPEKKISFSGAVGMQLALLMNKPPDPAVIENNMQVNIDCMKIIIDRSNLTKEQCALLDKNDFWQEQEITAIEAEVGKFRSLLKI